MKKEDEKTGAPEWTDNHAVSIELVHQQKTGVSAIILENAAGFKLHYLFKGEQLLQMSMDLASLYLHLKTEGNTLSAGGPAADALGEIITKRSSKKDGCGHG